MACGCFKHKDSEYSKTKRLAERLAGLEKTDYVIYEQDGKIYCESSISTTTPGENFENYLDNLHREVYAV